MEPPIYEVFLVLHPVSTRLGELARALEPLVAGEAPFTDLDVHHRPGSDTAVIALHYDERAIALPDVRRLEDIARGAGLQLVDPARLGPDERRVFFEVRLPQFETVARGLTRSRDVAIVLADRMGVVQHHLEQTPPPQPRATPPDGMRPAAKATRVVVKVPPLPPAAARTRMPRASSPPRPPTLPPPPEDTAVRGRARGKFPTVSTRNDKLALSLAEQAKQARRAAEALLRAPHVPTTALTPTDISGPDTQPVRFEDEPPSPPVAAIHALETARLQPSPRRGSEPPESAYVTIDDVTPPTLDVRFLRGNEWVPVRARALSARGAYLVTGAPARLGDTVHVSISCGGRTALVRGTVYHVTSADDAASTGASGFAVRFPEYACPARTHLVQVLLTARNAGVTLRPPPSRTAVRFPVRWPVTVTTSLVSFDADALDVSAGGLFLATTRELEVGAELRFALPLDLVDVPVEGVGRISRVLSRDEAIGRGMHAGFGVRITEMSEAHRATWEAFLDRVRRRTEKRVLVGAGPGRAEELAAALTAAGYTVTSGSDLGLLMRVAELDPCPPDLAVFDADFDVASAPAGWIEQIFAARQVQCVTIRGDVRRARSTVDRLLRVEA